VDPHGFEGTIKDGKWRYLDPADLEDS
ncbi:hypothetical protein Tco_1268938, partial [Tanacetum coccineum]